MSSIFFSAEYAKKIHLQSTNEFNFYNSGQNDIAIGYRGQDSNHPIQNYRFFQGLTDDGAFANIEARNGIFHGNVTIDNQILNNDDNSYMRIMCGDNTSDSPFIILNGNNGYGSVTKGLIAFTAQNTESIAPVILYIKPDGSLLFKGNYIGEPMDLGGAAIAAKSIIGQNNNYIKYASGFFLQYGHIGNVTANTNVAITFPISFSNTLTEIYFMPWQTNVVNSYPICKAANGGSKNTVDIRISADAQYVSWLAIGY